MKFILSLMTDHIFGRGILDEYNLKTWWEEVHDVFVTMNIVFLFLFGLSFTDEHAVCVPASKECMKDFSDQYDALEAYVSALCRFHEFRYFDPVYLQFLIVFLTMIPLSVSRFWFMNISFQGAVKAYHAAEKRFKKLGRSCNEVKTAIFQSSREENTQESKDLGSTPGTLIKANNASTGTVQTAKKLDNLTRNSHHNFTLEARFIAKSLWQCKPHYVPLNIAREFVIILCLICCLALLALCTHEGIDFIDGKIYDCTPNNTTGIHLNDRTFHCTLPWSYYDWLIICVYGVTTTLLFITRFVGCCIVCNEWRSGQSRSKGLKTDGDSYSCITSEMPWVQEEIGTEVVVSERAWKTRSSILFLNGLARKCRSGDDLNFVKFVDFIFSKDFVNSIYRLQETEQELGEISAIIRGKDLSEEKLVKLIKDGNWKSVVSSINYSLRPECDNIPRRKENVQKILRYHSGEINHSFLLYLALHRQKGQFDFQTGAAEVILGATSERTVSDKPLDGYHQDAEEFVENEYRSDKTYPLSIKEKLVRCIKKSDQPPVSFKDKLLNLIKRSRHEYPAPRRRPQTEETRPLLTNNATLNNSQYSAIAIPDFQNSESGGSDA